jgi:hypothetical protein
VDQINASPSGLINFPDPDQKLNLLEMQSDLASSDKFYMRLLEGLLALSQIPKEVIVNDEGIGHIAGVALQILYSPLVELTEKKQTTYGDMLVDLNGRLLEIGGFERKPVHCDWSEVIPTDPLAAAQTAGLQKGIGVSKRTLLIRMGFDPDVEAAQSEQEMDMQAEQDALAQAQMAEAMGLEGEDEQNPAGGPGSEGGTSSGGSSRGTGGFAPGLRGRRRPRGTRPERGVGSPGRGPAR